MQNTLIKMTSINSAAPFDCQTHNSGFKTGQIKVTTLLRVRQPNRRIYTYRLLLHAAYDLAIRRTPYYALLVVMTQQFFVFFVPGDLDLRILARFLYNVPNRQV